LSLGPFVLAEVDGVGLGGLVDASGKDRVTLRVEVRTAAWMKVDRLLVYRSGELVIDEVTPPPRPMSTSGRWRCHWPVTASSWWR
jgi:hypothetical protein